MSNIDVTVFGAGIFGLSIAWVCARRGAQVQVIDPGGVGSGASGGVVGALAPHVPENWTDKKQFQLESLLLAESWWLEVEAAGGGRAGYGRTGRLQPLLDARSVDLARARADTAQSLWNGAALWEVIEAPKDWAPATPTGFVIHDTLSARLHPRQACDALAQAITARGGIISHEGTPKGLQLWATGYHGLVEISEALAKPVGSGVKGQSLLVDYDARDMPHIYADGLYIVPHQDGTCAIGSTSERIWDAPATTDEQLDALHTRAVSTLRALDRAPVLARWAGIRPRSKSRAPMLGYHPTRPGAFIANGGFKIGFGMAPKVAETMADLILDGVDRIPDGFRVEASLT